MTVNTCGDGDLLNVVCCWLNNFSELNAFKYQVAGHGKIVQLSSVALAKPTSDIEIEFYKYVDSAIRFCSFSIPFARFMPPFYGFVKCNDRSALCCIHQQERELAFVADMRHSSYVILSNVVSDFLAPCLLDLKIGTRLYGPDADRQKKECMERKSRTTTSGRLGVRLTGMVVMNKNGDIVLQRDNEYGKSIDELGLIEAFRDFLFGVGLDECDRRERQGIVEFFIKEIEDIVDSVIAYPNVRFYSSSLLCIYDAASARKGVYMIDFAHSCFDAAAQKPDEQYLLGLDNAIRLLKKV